MQTHRHDHAAHDHAAHGHAAQEDAAHTHCAHHGHAARAAPPVVPTGANVQWTCPMHPEVVRDAPGNCPICGMALEPRTVTLDAVEDVHLEDITRRFWVCAGLSLPLFLVAMAEMIWGAQIRHVVNERVFAWGQLALATPVVLWGGWPFFERAWISFRTLRLNMYSLIGLGVAVAYLFSVFAVLAPGTLPEAFKAHGLVPLYFEAAAVITTLVLLGEVLELRARSQTSGAVRALLGLAPSTAIRVDADGTEREVPLAEVKPGETPAGAARLEDPGRRRRARGAFGRRRVDDHRGAAAGREDRGRDRHRRHAEPDRHVPDACGEGRRRHPARADRAPRR